MTLESKRKVELVRQVRARGGWARRHEDRYAVGILDVEVQLRNWPHLHIEGKITEGDQAFEPTPRQLEEGNRVMTVGGLVALVAWDRHTGQMFVSDWTNRAKPSECFTLGPDANYAATLEAWLRSRAYINGTRVGGQAQ